MLLAAATTPASGEAVLDAGCGVGAAALCLAARVPWARIAGVEIDEETAHLARLNVEANGVDDRLTITISGFDVLARNRAGAFDHVMTNPPFHRAGAHTRSPHRAKAVAHGEGAMDLDGWISAAALALKSGGRLTLIHRADRLVDLLHALGGRFGAIEIFPLWPRLGSAAGRIVIRAVKGRKTPPRILPGMVLHGPDGRYTDAAEAVLRDAAALDFGGDSA